MKSSRREFLSTSLAGLGTAAASSRLGIHAWAQGAARAQRPAAAGARAVALLCSRGEDWGRKVHAPAWEILAAGGASLDAVVAGANVLELDPEDSSVGYGGLPNEEGVVQLDASVMSGKLRKSGAVGAL